MASHLLSEKIDREESSVVKNTKDVKADSDCRKETESRIASAFPDDDENEQVEEKREESLGSTTDSADAGGESSVERCDVHSALSSLSVRSEEDQRLTAISFRADKNRRWENTKESPELTGEQTNPEPRLSLVQRRLQMFETRREHAERKVPSKAEKSKVQDSTVDTWDSSPDVLRANEEEYLEKSLEENSIIMDKCKDNFANVSEEQQDEDLKLMSIERSKEVFSKDIAWMNNEERLDVPQLEENSTISSIEMQKDSFAKIENEPTKNTDETNKEPVGTSLLTAKGIDLSNNYPEHLNPFNSDEEDSVVKDKPQMDTSRSSKVSTNPFDSEDEDVEQPEPPKPAIRSRFENQETVTKRILAAPQINLNPFWSDEEEEEEEERPDSDQEGRDRMPQGNVPVPRPRTIKYVILPVSCSGDMSRYTFPLPLPASSIIFYSYFYFSIFSINLFIYDLHVNRTTPEINAASRRIDLSRGSMYASNSSLTSSESTTTPGGTYRKKKPAPQPPAAKELFPSDQCESPVHNSALVMHQVSI